MNKEIILGSAPQLRLIEKFPWEIQETVSGYKVSRLNCSSGVDRLTTAVKSHLLDVLGGAGKLPPRQCNKKLGLTNPIIYDQWQLVKLPQHIQNRNASYQYLLGIKKPEGIFILWMDRRDVQFISYFDRKYDILIGFFTKPIVIDQKGMGHGGCSKTFPGLEVMLTISSLDIQAITAALFARTQVSTKQIARRNACHVNSDQPGKYSSGALSQNIRGQHKSAGWRNKEFRPTSIKSCCNIFS